MSQPFSLFLGDKIILLWGRQRTNLGGGGSYLRYDTYRT